VGRTEVLKVKFGVVFASAAAGSARPHATAANPRGSADLCDHPPPVTGPAAWGPVACVLTCGCPSCAAVGVGCSSACLCE